MSDPSGGNVLLAAAQWLQGTLLGTIATTIAVIAVAITGMLMLSGRIDVRRSASVVLGCFVVFGAPGIAAGLQSIALGSRDAADQQAYAPPIEPPAPPRIVPTPRPSVPYDPYAGASVPVG